MHGANMKIISYIYKECSEIKGRAAVSANNKL
jgi:hypothetical protein